MILILYLHTIGYILISRHKSVQNINTLVLHALSLHKTSLPNFGLENFAVKKRFSQCDSYAVYLQEENFQLTKSLFCVPYKFMLRAPPTVTPWLTGLNNGSICSSFVCQFTTLSTKQHLQSISESQPTMQNPIRIRYSHFQYDSLVRPHFDNFTISWQPHFENDSSPNQFNFENIFIFPNKFLYYYTNATFDFL